MTHQETFIQIYQEHIHRRGADQLLAWLQSDASDFFTAPSSTRYHGSYEGGLVEHSLNVYHCLVDYLARPRTKELYGMDYSELTIAELWDAAQEIYKDYPELLDAAEAILHG